MAESESDLESVDSDKELQVAFETGLLKPGLNIAVAEPKKAINDVDGLRRCLTELENGLPWIERMDLINEPVASHKIMEQVENVSTGDEVHDDFKREMTFYRQAQASALEGLAKLRKLGIATKRPDDYYAEMAKSDAHMKKVREKLLSKQLAIERREKARKMRDLRKYGKKVQHEVLQKRQQEKKQLMEAVKKYRKGNKSSLDFLEDDKSQKSGRGQQKTGRGQQKNNVHQPNKKRQLKNQKFGFGGQKKRSKMNTAESASSTKDFHPKHTTRPGKKIHVNQNKKRPGKTRRRMMNQQKKKR